MFTRYLVMLAATLIACSGSTPKPAVTHPPRADQIFSSRALRRTRTILELKLLELREARLNCVAAIINRRLNDAAAAKSSPSSETLRSCQR